jgi:hypothetical protein
MILPDVIFEAGEWLVEYCPVFEDLLELLRHVCVLHGLLAKVVQVKKTHRLVF